MEYLPFGDATFDAVTGINAFQFAGNPQRALREAARVTRPGGRMVASLFAAPEHSQGTVVHEAISALIPPGQAADQPYSCRPGHIEGGLGDGLTNGHGESSTGVRLDTPVPSRPADRWWHSGPTPSTPGVAPDPAASS